MRSQRKCSPSHDPVVGWLLIGLVVLAWDGWAVFQGKRKGLVVVFQLAHHVMVLFLEKRILLWLVEEIAQWKRLLY